MEQPSKTTDSFVFNGWIVTGLIGGASIGGMVAGVTSMIAGVISPGDTPLSGWLLAALSAVLFGAFGALIGMFVLLPIQGLSWLVRWLWQRM